MQDEVLLTAQECAGRIGLSVRALRLYEQYGLISPRRTSKQWRVYGSNEIARLNEISALKTLGFSLRDISKLLRGHSTDVVQMLALQKDALTDTRSRAERGLRVIESLLSKIRTGAAASIEDLLKLAKETNLADLSKDTAAWRRYEQMRPRAEVAMDAALYENYVGAYEFADGTLAVVSQGDGQLLYRIVGQSDLEIFPETDSEFFMKVLPVQIKFVRDPDGKAHSLMHHQNGSEDRAVRTDLEYVRSVEDEVQRRIREKKPRSEGDRVLRRMIEEHARGEPNLDEMSHPLAILVEEDKPFVKSTLEKAGALKALTFKGVSCDGLDVYDAEFEHMKMEWGFALTHRGKISHLYLRTTL
ncbi:MerR family transcriptional regulator [Rhizobium sp. BK251]|uniref:MerR family transcriptional regulator n=1 Tax=Rhizobium sp. BK251 TaxID=2512125 RepID=UPI0014049C74|nr:MerR family transcriptional regulator [Rhizobium sp. BK251]